MTQNSFRGGGRASQGFGDRGRGQSRGGGRTGGRQHINGDCHTNGNNNSRGGGRGGVLQNQNGNGRGRGRGGGSGYNDRDSNGCSPIQGRSYASRGRTSGYVTSSRDSDAGSQYSSNQRNGGCKSYQSYDENRNIQSSRGGRFNGRGGGRDGGRGRGNGGRADVVIRDKEARQIMTKHVRDVASVRPQQFFAKPQHERVSGNKIALRPNLVNPQIFKPVGVEQNLFEIESLVDTAYQYDFQVALKKGGEFVTSREVYQQAFQKLYEENQWSRSTIHDGRSTVWDKEGGLRQLDYHPVKIEAKKQEVYVVLKYTVNVDMSGLKKKALEKNVRDIGWIVPKECTRVLDSALRHSVLSNEDYRVSGSQIYSLLQKGEPIQNNMAMKLLVGYHQSVRVVTEGVVVNLNTIYKLAPKPSSVLMFLEDNRVNSFNEVICGNVLKDLNCMLGGVKVRTEVQCRDGIVQKLKQRIKCVSSQIATNHYFMHKGKEVSVYNYYQETYGYRLKYPKLNLLDCSKASGHQTMVPMEICTIMPGQFQRAEGRLQAELIKKAAKLPTLRHKDIQVALTDVKQRILEDPAQLWIGIAQTNWLRGQAFQIPAPIVQYKDRNVRPEKGEWKGFRRGENGQNDFHHYYDGKPIKSWSVISFSRNWEDVEMFCTDVVKFGQEVGMEVAPFEPQMIVQGENLDQVRKEQALQYIKLAEAQAKQYYKIAPQILFIIFERESTWGYQMFKTLLEGNTNVNCLKLVSSVVALDKYLKGTNNFSYLKQWMLKVNSKLNGTNFRLMDGFKFIPQGGSEGRSEGGNNFFPIMFMGADVTHPTGTNGNAGTSIAGVVATMDRNFARYSGTILGQQGKQENIDKMEKCTGNFLEQFSSTQKMLPKTIIMYRDGVSWGQYDQILSQEFRAMKAAINAFDSPQRPYNPKITFIVVQKRHHHRPRPTQDMQSDDGKGNLNLAPGTVIDCSGLHHCEFQFELQSHMTIQGTGRPAIYSVLVDEVGFGAEQLQMLTYWLTHTYQRCPKSVSIAPPAYLAHHVCTRGRIFENQGCTGSMVSPQMENQMYFI